MAQYAKHFTLDEARALLPALRRIFQEAHRAQRELNRRDESLAKRLHQTGGDIGGAETAEMLRLLHRLNACIHQITGTGVVLKDLERGLVDFPHMRDGHEVFLCWELDEDDVEFWHDLDAGYEGRERL